MNLAAIWCLPVVLVCENNIYGFSTHYKRTMLLDDIADRAKGYGIPGVVVDGMDVRTVYDVAGEAIDSARNGAGPTLIECKTYRYRGHSRMENPNYRTKEELEEWKKRDPIKVFPGVLRSEFDVTSEEISEVDKEVDKEIEAAVRFAEQSPDPMPSDYRSYIFA